MQSSDNNTYFWLLKLKVKAIATAVGRDRKSLVILVNTFRKVVSENLVLLEME